MLDLLREYFANLIANLAIWQSARSWRNPAVVASLHLVACNAVQRRAMQCRGVRAMRATCNDRPAYRRAGLARGTSPVQSLLISNTLGRLSEKNRIYDW